MKIKLIITLHFFFAINLFGQNVVLVKDTILENYTKSGFLVKNFVNIGNRDSKNLAQGFWKEYQILTEVYFEIAEGKPKRVLAKYLMYAEGNYLNNKKNGQWKWFVLEDKTFKKILNQQTTFVDGVLEGKFNCYYANKKLAHQGNYLNNKLDGISKTFYTDGKLYSIVTHKDHLKQGKEQFFFPNGAIEVEQNLVNGKKHGICKFYYENGTLRQLSHFKEGKEDSIYQYYHKNGQLWIEKTYDDGLLLNVKCNYDAQGKGRDKGTLQDGNGTLMFYDEDGKLYHIKAYKKGIAVHEERL